MDQQRKEAEERERKEREEQDRREKARQEAERKRLDELEKMMREQQEKERLMEEGRLTATCLITYIFNYANISIQFTDTLSQTEKDRRNNARQPGEKWRDSGN